MLSPNLNTVLPPSELRQLANKAQYLRACIIADKGAGKTSLCETLPRPVHLWAFDPGGESVLRLKDGPSAGEFPDWLIPDTRFQVNEGVDIDNWWKDTVARNRAGYWNTVGTVVLDTTTTFGEALVKKVDFPVPEKGMKVDSRALWGLYAQLFCDYMKYILHLPCHVVLLGHIKRKENEKLGTVWWTIRVPGSSDVNLQNWVGEFWGLKIDAKVTGEAKFMDGRDVKQPDYTRYLVTGPDGKFPFTTRMGSKTFNLFEPPNVRALMQKAGWSGADKESNNAAS